MPTDLPNNKKSKTIKKFRKFADFTNRIVGSPYWFMLSILLVLIWLPSGIFFGWGEIWHLLINTTTTILTFLMMSLLHASQSKWEERMDRLQEKELKALREEMSLQKEMREEKEEEKEAVNSLR